MSGYAGAAALLAARFGLLHFPALIVGGIQIWAGATVCLVVLVIVLTRRAEVDSARKEEEKHVGKAVLIPMIVGAVAALAGIGFYAWI